MNAIGSNRSDNYNWYVVYTRSRAEKKAYRELVLKGIESYLPLRTVKKSWGKQSRTIDEPLIRGYVFVRVSYREFYDVLFASGVLHYVCFEGKPAVITDQQVESLKKIMQTADRDVLVTSEHIKKGDDIMVVSGPLKNFRAEVVDIRGKYRLLIRFENLGCCVHVEIGANKVVPVPSRKDANSKKVPLPGICLFAMIMLITFPSCVVNRNLEYMREEREDVRVYQAQSIDDYKLKQDDELYIQVSSLDGTASGIFSASASQQLLNISTIQPYGASLISYVVDKQGCIFLPVIGFVQVEGMTTAQVAEAITKLLNKILNQPVVTVKLVNRYVSVLGEVKNPGHFSYSQNKLSVYDALGLAGDITDYGDRNEVLLTRNEGGQNIKINLDLTRSDMLASEYYYIRPNDMIYVKPLRKKFWGLKEFPYSTIISSITAAILFYSAIK